MSTLAILDLHVHMATDHWCWVVAVLFRQGTDSPVSPSLYQSVLPHATAACSTPSAAYPPV